ncbi:MAG: hypothetical protein V1875_02015 [Candidatus Altiarchaeota archaeon]
MRGEFDTRTILISCAILGVAVGVMSSIPVLMFPNICCLWIILGGFTATYLACRRDNTIEPVEAALVGAIFGIVYGITVNVATFLVRIPLNLLGWGVAVRGVTGTGILDILGLKLGFSMLGSTLVVLLNIFLGIVFGAFGGVLYAVSIESSEPAKPSQKMAKLGRI